ncbi:MAG: HD domain-containing protein [Desulfobacter sp.]|nr:MAG: HD domain-containing protein [Desulfobacter sp.]
MTEDDLKLIEIRFREYTDAYISRAGDPYPFTLKQAHTLRVCENILMLAGSLKLDGQTVLLAHAAALAHDLGRFPQFEIYGTFSDPLSRNHGALGVGVLVKQGMLAELDRGDRQMVLRAVALHNRPRLPSGLAPELDLLSRLLRDADKIDIYRVMKAHYLGEGNGSRSFITHRLPDDGRFSRKFVDRLMAGRAIPYNEVASLNNMKLFQLGMARDLNFSAAFRAVMAMGVVDAILGSMPDSPMLEELGRVLNARLEKAAGLN